MTPKQQATKKAELDRLSDRIRAKGRGAGRVWWHCLPVTVQRAMRTANRRAGTEGITPHCLRHAWATHAADDGASLQDLRVILGHKSIETTARYVRPNPERVPSPIEKMDFAA